jgi:long-chain acyl-CoA synthetase
VLTTTAVSNRAKVGSIGRPLPGVSLLLRTPGGAVLWQDGSPTPADDLAELDLSVADSAGTDPGEIVVRGANLFSGYWPDGHDGPDPDGWWATGDIAYADGDGDLVLVDRIGELILVHGFNVYPAEIERVLDSHPGVAEAAVVGVPDPDTGQAPYAYVVPALDPPPTPAELRVYCAGRLARYKLPATIELVDKLPHSATGKVRKGELH